MVSFLRGGGDLNGDGKPDLAVANQGGVSAYNAGWPTAYANGSVSVLLGKGDGTFDPPVNYATGNYARDHSSVAIGDFNGDGRRDLAVANYASYAAIGYTNGDVSVLFGNGDGTFQPAASYMVGAAPGSRAAVRGGSRVFPLPGGLVGYASAKSRPGVCAHPDRDRSPGTAYVLPPIFACGCDGICL